MAQQQMSPDAKFILDLTDLETPVLIFDPGDGSPEREIAWRALDASLEDFRWFCSSAASFHHRTLQERR